jgi:hypothetical protein
MHKANSEWVAQKTGRSFFFGTLIQHDKPFARAKSANCKLCAGVIERWLSRRPFQLLEPALAYYQK